MATTRIPLLLAPSHATDFGVSGARAELVRRSSTDRRSSDVGAPGGGASGPCVQLIRSLPFLSLDLIS